MPVLPPEVPGPNPGQPGHYAHHDWLTASVHALASGVAPVGAMMLWPSAVPPQGWLLCDGTSTPTIYPELLAVVGATLPDLRDRFPVGASATKAVATQGGASALVAANLPPHAHTIGHSHTMAHTHVVNRQASTGDGGGVTRGGGSSVANMNTGGSSAGNTGGASTGNSGNGPGTGTPFNPPYTAVNFIIKADAI